MNSKGMEAGSGHSPATEESAAVYRYTPNIYIKDGSPSDDLQQLRNEPAIRDFANVTPETYELIKATNPTLLLFMDLAKRIMTEVEE